MQEDWNTRFENARKRHIESKRLRGEKDLIRIGSTKSELKLPPDVFTRLGGKPTREEVIWHCSECDECPTPRQYANGFVPGKCLCQIAKAEQERREKDRLEIWRAQQESQRRQCARCYSWLGDEWSSIGLSNKSFENFEMSLQSEGFLAAVAFASALLGCLILWSDESWGTGKTHLAAAICNSLLSQNIPCLFSTAQNMFNGFTARMDEHQGYSDLLAMAGKTPLLVIDDLDKAHMTASGYKQSIFFEVLNQRYLRHLPTVITTNARVKVTHNDVAGISEYIGQAAASRICDRENGGLVVVEMNGDDYRRRER
jgi:DNA replication protein DnaC